MSPSASSPSGRASFAATRPDAMCGRYTETAAFEELARRFGIEVEEADNEELISR